MFDPLFLSPKYLLLEQRLGMSCSCSVLQCIDREFLFSWESACDQHRSNKHSLDRGQRSCILLQE
ncbi:unnamed protein product, partial [Staurois parvus]